MIAKYLDKQNDKIDYASYEKLLQKISSVHLENIIDLQSKSNMYFEESFSQVSESYYRKIEQIIKESIREV